jgi:hypothetical protein
MSAGHCFAEGLGVDKDEKQAAFWYEKPWPRARHCTSVFDCSLRALSGGNWLILEKEREAARCLGPLHSQGVCEKQDARNRKSTGVSAGRTCFGPRAHEGRQSNASLTQRSLLTWVCPGFASFPSDPLELQKDGQQVQQANV